MKSFIILALAQACLSASAFATPAAGLFSDDTSAFAKIKSLAGTWTGNAKMGDENVPTTVRYRVVSGGFAVEETIAPDDPHAMVTMYYMDGKSLVMTHYCHMGNQPHMKLASSASPDNLKFDFDGGANIAPGSAHMHDLSLKLLSADHIEAHWHAMVGGKPMMDVDMDLHRSATTK